MIIPDINLLLYAVITGFPQHRRAHAWWQDTVNGHTRIGLTYPALFGFLRIATSARVLAAPLPTADAIAYVREWLSQPNVDLLTAGPRHLDIALGLLDKLGTASHLTTMCNWPPTASNTTPRSIPVTPTLPDSPI